MATSPNINRKLNERLRLLTGYHSKAYRYATTMAPYATPLIMDSSTITIVPPRQTTAANSATIPPVTEREMIETRLEIASATNKPTSNPIKSGMTENIKGRMFSVPLQHSVIDIFVLQ
eukprot:sb/3476463/